MRLWEVQIHAPLLFKYSMNVNEIKWINRISKIYLRNESTGNNFFVYRGINKKGLIIASRRVAHCCKCFPFFFSIDTSINFKNIRFISYHLIFSSNFRGFFSVHFNKEIDHSNSYERRIISNFWRRRDTYMYNVTIQFLVDAKITLIF